MPETPLQVLPPNPLTVLTDDEILFRDNIRQFAEERIRPLVKEMDEKGVFDPGLIREFFQLGLMGIEIPGGLWRRRRQILRSYSCGRGTLASRRFRWRHRGRPEHAGDQCIVALGDLRAEKTVPAANGRRHLRRLCIERGWIRLRRFCSANPRRNCAAAITF